MNWLAHIMSCYEPQRGEKRCELREGASVQRLDELEAVLGMDIPAPLRELLSVTDGVDEALFVNGRWMVTQAAVWSCDEIERENLARRSGDHVPVRPTEPPGVKPFYFASAGVDGIVFAFFVSPSEHQDLAVHAYDPLEREWQRISASLAVHLRGWTV